MFSDNALDRVARLLDLIPLLSRSGANLDAISGQLGVSIEQLQRDLEIAFLCGLPGYTPDLLIDIAFDGNSVFVTNPQTLEKPRSLSPEELISLKLGLDLISVSYPGADQLQEIVKKIKTNLGLVSNQEDSSLQVLDSDFARSVNVIENAIVKESRLSFSYIDTRGALTISRVVSPWQLLWLRGRMLLRGYDHSRHAPRQFMVHRMSDVRFEEGEWLVITSDKSKPVEAYRSSIRLSQAPMWWRRRYQTLIEEIVEKDGAVIVSLRYWSRDSLKYSLLPVLDFLLDVSGEGCPLDELKGDLLSHFSAFGTPTDQQTPLI